MIERIERVDSETVVMHTPPVDDYAGGFLASVRDAVQKGKVPWVRVESIEGIPSIAEILSGVLGVRLEWLVLRDSDRVVGVDPYALRAMAAAPLIEIAVGTSYQDVLGMVDRARLSRVKRVWSPGEYAAIGESIVVWPLGSSDPVRLEMENNYVAKIGHLDTTTWRMTEERETLSVRQTSAGEDRTSDNPFDELVSGEAYKRSLSIRMVAAQTGIVPSDVARHIQKIDLDARLTKWNDALVKQRLTRGWQVVVATLGNADHVEMIRRGIRGIRVVRHELPIGWESASMKFMLLTDHELWGTIHLEHRSRLGRSSITSAVEINPGEYVVHEDHGVALFAGVREIEQNGELKEFLELRYAGKDRLYVPMTQLHRITHYVGAGTAHPKLTKLGGGEWNRVKRRVTKAVRLLAGELLRLYAVRQLTRVEAIPPDIMDISDFERSFEFVETDDQLQAVEDIRHDLQKDQPFDRLVVGDVGFGKTEVAMRAAYMLTKVGKQVAVLAPTTVLVEQHYRVWRDRFEPYGVSVDALSRFLSDEEAAKVVSRIKDGTVDIVIGTHRLLSDGVSFKRLGLVIIDEEQKFGVAQKEKLKSLRIDAHVLSLSATPIPRTLHMALSGVRDISVIAIPPTGRRSIKNIVKPFSWEEVKRAIAREVHRNGQVYLVHNRVSTIENFKTELSERNPNVRIGIGHGQMTGPALSRVMRDFLDHAYDVLLCTTIIENGLDIRNVNTLIVEGAENFGLAQLYQMRGRVGRGDRQAYAYFLYHGHVEPEKLTCHQRSRMTASGLEAGSEFDELTERPTLSKEKVSDASLDNVTVDRPLGQTMRQRLDAIEQLHALGSGFQLAQRDLEIRGAGNFLGREQHGIVSSVGFTLYCRLLEEMIDQVRKGLSDNPK